MVRFGLCPFQGGHQLHLPDHQPLGTDSLELVLHGGVPVIAMIIAIMIVLCKDHVRRGRPQSVERCVVNVRHLVQVNGSVDNL